MKTPYHNPFSDLTFSIAFKVILCSTIFLTLPSLSISRKSTSLRELEGREIISTIGKGKGKGKNNPSHWDNIYYQLLEWDYHYPNGLLHKSTQGGNGSLILSRKERLGARAIFVIQDGKSVEKNKASQPAAAAADKESEPAKPTEPDLNSDPFASTDISDDKSAALARLQMVKDGQVKDEAEMRKEIEKKEWELIELAKKAQLLKDEQKVKAETLAQSEAAIQAQSEQLDKIQKQMEAQTKQLTDLQDRLKQQQKEIDNANAKLKDPPPPAKADEGYEIPWSIVGWGLLGLVSLPLGWGMYCRWTSQRFFYWWPMVDNFFLSREHSRASGKAVAQNGAYVPNGTKGIVKNGNGTARTKPPGFGPTPKLAAAPVSADSVVKPVIPGG